MFTARAQLRPAVATILAFAILGGCSVSVTSPSPGASLPTSPTPGVTQPPGIPTMTAALPTLPPGIPTLPPIPSLPAVTLPPVPTLPPITLPPIPTLLPEPTTAPTPEGSATGDCTIISAAKVVSIVGSTVTVSQADPNDCLFLGDFSGTSAFAGLDVRTGTDETVAAAKATFGGGKDLKVAGHTAYWASDITSLYVDLGTDTLVVQIVMPSDPTKALSMATKIAQAIIGG